MEFPKFVLIADYAVLVEFGDTINEAATIKVLDLDQALSASPPHGMGEVVPAYVNLLVTFDPIITDHVKIISAIKYLLEQPANSRRAPTAHVVHVCYDDEFAPDLDVVANAKNMSPESVINAHLSGQYKIAMYGFAPGYAYMSGVPLEIQMPRKQAAVRDIPAGAVMIAGPQCLVSTLLMPSGWSVLGSSPARILTDNPTRPFLFDVGDTVAFTRVDRATFEALAKAKT